MRSFVSLEEVLMRIRVLWQMALFLAVVSCKFLPAQGYTLTVECSPGSGVFITESVSVPTVVASGSPINGTFSFNSNPTCFEEFWIARWVGPATNMIDFEVCYDFLFTWTDSSGTHNDGRRGGGMGANVGPPIMRHSPFIHLCP